MRPPAPLAVMDLPPKKPPSATNPEVIHKRVLASQPLSDRQIQVVTDFTRAEIYNAVRKLTETMTGTMPVGRLVLHRGVMYDTAKKRSVIVYTAYYDKGVDRDDGLPNAYDSKCPWRAAYRAIRRERKARKACSCVSISRDFD